MDLEFKSRYLDYWCWLVDCWSDFWSKADPTKALVDWLLAFELRRVKLEKPATEPLFLNTVDWGVYWPLVVVAAAACDYYLLFRFAMACKFWDLSKLRLFLWPLFEVECVLLVVKWPGRDPGTLGKGIRWLELEPRLYRLTLYRLPPLAFEWLFCWVLLVRFVVVCLHVEE